MHIQAINVSQHILDFHGEIKPVGIYANALNFISPQQQLITFHREGRCLSPMGWQFTSTDFDYLAQLCQSSIILTVTTNEINALTGLKISVGQRQNLQLNESCIPDIRWLESFFSLLSPKIETGLFGPLKNYRQIALSEDIKLLKTMFQRQLAGEHLDWAIYIGKGPGLTPSSDDMLIGMLFSLYLMMPEKAHKDFFNNTAKLSDLTTLVSQHYLTYAAQGIFSTYLIQLGKKMKNKQLLFKETLEILSVGHHSGADTLLGLWVGYQVIKNNFIK
nr:DUF2877 domain-containing protein [uncultured Moellerella sp.]